MEMRYILALVLSLTLGVSAMAEDNVEVKIDQRRVQFDERVFRGADGAFSTINQIREEKLENENFELRNSMQRMQAQLDLLMKMVRQAPVAEQPQVEEPVGGDIDDFPDPSDAVEEEPVQPPVNEIDPTTYQVTDLDVRAFRIFNKSCVNCHNEKKQNGGFQLLNQEKQTLVLHPLQNRAIIWAAVTGEGKDLGIAEMPYNNSLSDKDKNVIKEWMLEEAIRQREMKKK